MSIPRQSSVWDERRNTSRVFPVPPGYAEAALRALADFRRDNPLHAVWVAGGAPSIRSDADHRARFGEPYTAKPRRAK